MSSVAGLGVGAYHPVGAGQLADAVGLTPVLLVIAALPLPALALAAMLPAERRPARA